MITLKDFDIAGVIRPKRTNSRGVDAEWIAFACTRPELDLILEAIRIKLSSYSENEIPAGTLLAKICSQWMEMK